MNGKTDELDAELGVLVAVARGSLKGQLRTIRTQTRKDRAALLRGVGLRSYDPATMAVAVATFLLVTLGPIPTFRAVRSSGEYLVDDLQVAALVSGIVMVIAAAWVLGAELLRSGRFGSRSGIYDSFVVALFFLWSLAGIVMVLVRAERHGIYGTVSFGLILQGAALVLFAVSFVVARAHRRATAERQVGAPEQERLRLERTVHHELDRVLSTAHASDLDRAALASGLGELVRRGVVSEHRAQALLTST
jgi:hypothetical protein